MRPRVLKPGRTCWDKALPEGEGGKKNFDLIKNSITRRALFRVQRVALEWNNEEQLTLTHSPPCCHVPVFARGRFDMTIGHEAPAFTPWHRTPGAPQAVIAVLSTFVCFVKWGLITRHDWLLEQIAQMKELVNTQLCGARRLRVDLRWKNKRKRGKQGCGRPLSGTCKWLDPQLSYTHLLSTNMLISCWPGVSWAASGGGCWILSLVEMQWREWQKSNQWA